MPSQNTKRGGRRPGAGRKRAAAMLEIETLISQATTKADWLMIIKKLVTMAKGGDVKAIKLLLEYAYGKPKQMIEHTTPGDQPLQIQIVEVREPSPGRGIDSDGHQTNSKA